MSKPESPREWFIGYPDAVSPLITTDESRANEYAPPHQLVKLVEKSAFEQVRKERDELKLKLEEIISYMPKVPTQPYEKELAQQLAEALTEIARLKKALK